jgi:hypothetical protein
VILCPTVPFRVNGSAELDKGLWTIGFQSKCHQLDKFNVILKSIDGGSALSGMSNSFGLHRQESPATRRSDFRFVLATKAIWAIHTDWLLKKKESRKGRKKARARTQDIISTPELSGWLFKSKVHLLSQDIDMHHN